MNPIRALDRALYNRHRRADPSLAPYDETEPVHPLLFLLGMISVLLLLVLVGCDL